MPSEDVSESFDRGCPLCGQIGKATMSIGDESELEEMEYSRYQCNNSDCKIDEYRLGRRAVTDGGQEVGGVQRSCDLCDSTEGVAREPVTNEATGEVLDVDLCEDHLIKLEAYNRGRRRRLGVRSTEPHEKAGDRGAEEYWRWECTVAPYSFKRLVEAVGQAVDEAVIHFGDGHLYIPSVDPANVISITASGEIVEDSDDPNIAVGFNIEEFLEDPPDFSKHGPPFNIQVEHRPNGEHTLTIKNIEIGEHEYQAFDPNSCRDAPDIPDIDWVTETTVRVEKLRGLTWAFGDKGTSPILLSAEDEQVSVRGSGGFGLSAKNEVEQGGYGVYTGEHLGIIAQALPDSGKARLKLGEQEPVLISTAGLEICLAPRIVQEGKIPNKLKEAAKEAGIDV